MNILQVSKFYAPQVGGIERVAKQLAEGLDDRGHSVTVLASALQGRGSREQVNGIPVVRTCSAGTLLSTPFSPTYPRRLRELSDVDIVHIHLPNPLAAASELLVDRTDASIVVTYHSDIVRQRLAGRFYRPLLRYFLEKTDRIITTSPRLRDNSPILNSFTDRCSIVPLSVSPHDKSAHTSEPPVDVDGPFVLFVGRLNYYKGVEYLIESMESIEAALVVVGDGPRRDQLEQQAANSDASVVFLGHVDDETLEQCYASAEVFALPSVEPSEAFGIVQLEAMAHGLPVVNTNLPTGVPWVSKHGETGLTVEPRHSDQLSKAISQLLGDKKLRQKLGAAGQKRVATKFSEDRMIDTTIDIYNFVQ